MKSLKPAHTKWILTGSLLLVLGFNLSIHQFPKDEHGFALIHSRDLQMDMKRDVGMIDLASRDPAEEPTKAAAATEAGKVDPKTAAKPAAKPRPARPGSTAVKAKAEKAAAKKADENPAAEVKPAGETDARQTADAAAAKAKLEQQAAADKAEKEKEQAKEAKEAKDVVTVTTTKIEGQNIDGKKALIEIITTTTRGKDGKETVKMEAKTSFPGCTECESSSELIPSNVASTARESAKILEFLKKQAEEKKQAKKEKTKAEEDELFAKIKEDCEAKRDSDKPVEELTCRKDKLIALFKEKGKKKTTGTDAEKKEANKDKIDKAKFVKFYKDEILKKMGSALQPKFRKDDSSDPSETRDAVLALIEESLSELPPEMEESRKQIVQFSAAMVNNAGAEVQRVRLAQNSRVLEQQAIAKANGQTYNKALDTTYQAMEFRAQQTQMAARDFSFAVGDHVKSGLGQYFDGESASDTRKFFGYMNAFGNNNMRINQALLNPTDSRFALSEFDLTHTDRFGLSTQLGYNIPGSTASDGLVTAKPGTTATGSEIYTNPRLTRSQAAKPKPDALRLVQTSGRLRSNSNGSTLGATTLGSGLTLNNNTRSAFGGTLYDSNGLQYQSGLPLKPSPNITTRGRQLKRQ